MDYLRQTNLLLGEGTNFENGSDLASLENALSLLPPSVSYRSSSGGEEGAQETVPRPQRAKAALDSLLPVYADGPANHRVGPWP